MTKINQIIFFEEELGFREKKNFTYYSGDLENHWNVIKLDPKHRQSSVELEYQDSY